ncbi:MAG: exosortase/archaeosortase family protein [Planctomycetota bacterium]|jgi:exosortase
MADAPADTSSHGGVATPGRGVLLGAVVVAVLLLLVFWDFFAQQVRFAVTRPSDWGHTLVIPFIAGWFVWLRRPELARAGLRTTWIGFVPILLGLSWYMLSVFGPQVLNHHNLRGAGLGLSLLGIVLLFTGWRALRWLLFPLAYLVLFGQTISERFMQIITEELQDFTAVGAELVLSVTGTTVTREGNTIYVLLDGGEMHPLNIAQACSGMRTLMAFMALGVAMAYTGLSRWWQRSLLVVLGIPVAIIVNILRVITLGYLSMYDPGLAAGDFHSLVGMVWLVPAFLLFLLVLWVVRNLVVEPEAAHSTPAVGGGAES